MPHRDFAPILNCVRVPLTKARTPTTGQRQIYCDNFWVVTPDEELLFHAASGTPQCHSRRVTITALRDRLYPGCEVRIIDAVYVPLKTQEAYWCDPDAY